MGLPVCLSLACLVSVAALLLAQARGWVLARVLSKLAASTCFVLLALALGATASLYGQLVLLALLLGWLGDACLLSARSAAFMAGLGAFLLSHLAYAAAFASAPMHLPALALALALAVVLGWYLLRWLMPTVSAHFKTPVRAYVLVILAMCCTAAAHAVGHERGAVLLGALLFALSDVAVAREQFVRRSPVNRLWGLPTYYAAQLLLAWSVLPPA